jgi:hypothetical protein
MVASRARRPMLAVVVAAVAAVALFAMSQALRADWLNATALSLVVSSYGLATVTAGALWRTALIPIDDPNGGQVWQGTTVASGEWIVASVFWYSIALLALYALRMRRSR